MNKKNITPNPKHPVDRMTTGKLPNLLAELEEASLSVTGTLPAAYHLTPCGRSSDRWGAFCSYEGEDE